MIQSEIAEIADNDAAWTASIASVELCDPRCTG
jgi:hypothetical protein